MKKSMVRYGVFMMGFMASTCLANSWSTQTVNVTGAFLAPNPGGTVPSTPARMYHCMNGAGEHFACMTASCRMCFREERIVLPPTNKN